METKIPATGSYLRHAAVKVSIGQILQGIFFQEPDEPSYLQTTDERKLFRVNLMASILGKEKTGSVTSLMLDDGTGQITLRFFEESSKIRSFDIGDLVLVVGRVRVYNREKYLSAEIVKEIEPSWLKVRKEELKSASEDIPEEIVQEKIETKSGEKLSPLSEKSFLPTEKIIKVIEELDRGQGVLIEEVVGKTSLQDTEQVVEKMLKEGMIFQVQPGRIKVL